MNNKLILSLTLCLTANTFGMRRAVTATPKMLQRNYALMSNEQMGKLKDLMHSPEFPQVLAQTAKDTEDLSNLLRAIQKKENTYESIDTKEYRKMRDEIFSLLKCSGLQIASGPGFMGSAAIAGCILNSCVEDLGCILAAPIGIYGICLVIKGSYGLFVGGILYLHNSIKLDSSECNDRANPKFKIVHDNIRHLKAQIASMREVEESQIVAKKN